MWEACMTISIRIIVYAITQQIVTHEHNPPGTVVKLGFLLNVKLIGDAYLSFLWIKSRKECDVSFSSLFISFVNCDALGFSSYWSASSSSFIFKNPFLYIF